MLIEGGNNVTYNRFYLIGLLFLPYFVFSQKDSTKVFEEITIIRVHKSIEEHTTLRKSEITKIAPNDVGELLQFINGVTVKNYGGIGGMKTLSNRGLGGEHTQLIIDGQPINDAQNGQINFATIQPNNIEEISVNYQSESNRGLLPVSALTKGSNVQITTFEQQFSNQPITIRSNFTIGSFGQKEAYMGVKIGDNTKYISATGGYSAYKGNYPYRLSFTNSQEEYIRKNNALNDFYVGFGGGWRWNDLKGFHHVIQLLGNTHKINQQLPGAVVLYNDYAKETLKTWNTRVGMKYKAFLGDFQLNVFANYSNRYLHYYDPNYLNIDGFLDYKYILNSVISGFHLKYNWKALSIHLGHDFGYDYLESNKNLLGQPNRLSNTSMLNAQYNWKYFNVQASVFAQVYNDQNGIINHRDSYVKTHPQIAVFTSDKLLKNWQFFAWYKPSSRAASFNELYFSQVGNKELKPEESSQVDVGVRYIKQLNDFNLQVQMNGFKNLVKNKILALPTKNMFIWSIQNIGKVDIYGADINIIGKWNINQNWGIDFQTGGNYQKALDIADEESPTYKHQIAYTPEFTGNTILSGRYKSIGLHFALLYIGERYSLNENISANRLKPYYTLDISASYDLILKEKHTLKFHAGVKNVTNQAYSFIRYFEMPGVNYFVRIGYEL